ncbi:MAG: glycosyltransferase [Desulfamplus sp.]|nr:glycosyltransferase [Desulfamplus sp.]
MKTVGIYRTVYPFPSETFIGQQARALRLFHPVMILRTALSYTDLNPLALNRMAWGRLRSAVFSLTGCPQVFGSRLQDSQISLIHAHFGPDGTYAMNLAHMLGVPLVVTFHGCDCTIPRAALLRTGKISNWRFVLRENRLRKSAARVIAVSHFIACLLRDRGYSADQVIQHYIGVDIDRFHPVKERQLYILCVGRHTEKKGLDTLLRAFARIASKHPDYNVIQVGTGPLTAELKRQVKTLGIADRVAFLGNKTNDEVRHLMQSCTLFALPSQTASCGDSEALGIVFNEASACGIPIAATHHGGIPEAVIDGETGILVKERDDIALANAMDCILSDPGFGRRLGQRGREYVCDVFDLVKQTAKLEVIYENVLG